MRFFQTDDMGSLRYARRCQSREEKVVAMLSLDTIAYFSDKPGSQRSPDALKGKVPTVGNFVAFVGNEDSRYYVDAARAVYSNGSDIPALALVLPEEIAGVGWSDHWSFWQAGYPGFLLTDSAIYRYPHYHKATDTIDKIDLNKLESVTKGVEAVVRSLANPE